MIKMRLMIIVLSVVLIMSVSACQKTEETPSSGGAPSYASGDPDSEGTGVEGYYTPDDGQANYKGVYFPKPKQPEFLYVISRNSMSEHEKIMVASMQGVTAKTQPCIWIEGASKSGSIWLNDMKERFGVKTESVSTAWDLLGKVKSQFEGYILYDLTDKTSLNAATSMAGPYKAIVVDKSIESKVKDSGLQKIFDTTGKTDQWLYNQFKDKFGEGERDISRQVLLEQRGQPGDERNFTLRDYSIFCNAATIFQGATPLMSDFLKLLKKPSILLGWADDEIWGENQQGEVAVKDGVLRVASDWATNISVTSAFYPKGNIPQLTETKPEELKAEENVHYVTFIWTDGDNIQWLLGDFPVNTTFWGSPSRGKFNMGWGMNSLMYEAAPTALEYFYKTAANQPQGKDYFVLGPNFAYAADFNKDSFPEYVKNMSDFMGKTGLKYAQVNETGQLLDKDEKALDIYTEQKNIHGLFYLDYRAYDHYKGKVLWSNGKPIVTAKYAIWLEEDRPGDASPEYVASQLNKQPTDPSSADSYSFVTVHAWAGYTMTDLYDMTKTLNPNIRVVSPDEFMQRLVKNVKH